VSRLKKERCRSQDFKLSLGSAQMRVVSLGKLGYVSLTLRDRATGHQLLPYARRNEFLASAGQTGAVVCYGRWVLQTSNTLLYVTSCFVKVSSLGCDSLSTSKSLFSAIRLLPSCLVVISDDWEVFMDLEVRLSLLFTVLWPRAGTWLGLTALEAG
jgi:hypothetical protein